MPQCLFGGLGTQSSSGRRVTLDAGSAQEVFGKVGAYRGLQVLPLAGLAQWEPGQEAWPRAGPC